MSERTQSLTGTEELEAREALERLIRFLGRYGYHASFNEDTQALHDLSTLKRLLRISDE